MKKIKFKFKKEKVKSEYSKKKHTKELETWVASREALLYEVTSLTMRKILQVGGLGSKGSSIIYSMIPTSSLQK